VDIVAQNNGVVRASDCKEFRIGVYDEEDPDGPYVCILVEDTKRRVIVDASFDDPRTVDEFLLQVTRAVEGYRNRLRAKAGAR
jgi:hypothetical protein